MQFTKFFFTISIFFLLTFCKEKQEKEIATEPKKDLYFVSANPVLNMRDSPDKNGKILLKIPKESIVEVLKTEPNIISLDGHLGKWVLIKFQDQKGYVFSTFLKKEMLTQSNQFTKIKTEINNSKSHYFIVESQGPADKAAETCDPNGYLYNCIFTVFDKNNAMIYKGEEVYPMNWYDDSKITLKKIYADNNYGKSQFDLFNVTSKEITDFWIYEYILYSETPSWGPTDGSPMIKEDIHTICKFEKCFELNYSIEKKLIKILKGDPKKRSLVLMQIENINDPPAKSQEIVE